MGFFSGLEKLARYGKTLGFAAVGLLATYLPAFGQDRIGVSGRVVDQNGKPVDAAQVQIDLRQKNSKTDSLFTSDAQTSIDGKFTGYFESIPSDTADFIPGVGLISQVYPNPGKKQRKVDVDLISPQFLKMVLYNAGGQEVSDLYGSQLQAGRHQVVFNIPPNISDGVYFLRVSTENMSKVLKFTFLKYGSDASGSGTKTEISLVPPLYTVKAVSIAGSNGTDIVIPEKIVLDRVIHPGESLGDLSVQRVPAQSKVDGGIVDVFGDPIVGVNSKIIYNISGVKDSVVVVSDSKGKFLGVYPLNPSFVDKDFSASVERIDFSSKNVPPQSFPIGKPFGDVALGKMPLDKLVNVTLKAADLFDYLDDKRIGLAKFSLIGSKDTLNFTAGMDGLTHQKILGGEYDIITTAPDYWRVDGRLNVRGDDLSYAEHLVDQKRFVCLL